MFKKQRQKLAREIVDLLVKEVMDPLNDGLLRKLSRDFDKIIKAYDIIEKLNLKTLSNKIDSFSEKAFLTSLHKAQTKLANTIGELQQTIEGLALALKEIEQ